MSKRKQRRSKKRVRGGKPARASLFDRLSGMAISALLLGGVAITVYQMVGGSGSGSDVDISVPHLSNNARQGQVLFAETCAACHGANASGGDQGPPLIHDTYNPGHHDDQAFYRAAARGVPQHHWPYGDMPAQPTVSRAEMTKIIRFVRETQVANGIVFRPHRM